MDGITEESQLRTTLQGDPSFGQEREPAGAAGSSVQTRVGLSFLAHPPATNELRALRSGGLSFQSLEVPREPRQG